MFYQKMGVMLGLIAALASAIISVLNNDTMYDFSFKLVVSAAAFYILGSVVKLFLDRNVFKKEDESEEKAEDTEIKPDADDEE